MKLLTGNERWRLFWAWLFLVLLAAAVNVTFAASLIEDFAGYPRIARYQGAEAAARGWPSSTPHPEPWPKPDDWILTLCSECGRPVRSSGPAPTPA